MEGFNSLDLFHKSNILKQQAIHLLTIEIDDNSVKLYGWDRFFIEEHFNEQQQVTRINLALKDDMVKYLKKITLSDLGYPTVL